MIASEDELVGLALALGARKLGPLAPEEDARAKAAAPVARATVKRAADEIAAHRDPLGDAFCALRSPATRRPMGATYTPAAIVTSMVAWGARAEPVRVVDPGAGSARFLVAAGRAIPNAELVAVEVDPVASLLARAHLATAGLAARARVVVGDYRALSLPPVAGRTLFLGNPPYVRHHGIAPAWKRWLTREARRFDLPASQLAGLHVHFFVATARLARAGDAGAFVTSSEWLDVNYGALARALLVGPLGVSSVHTLDPTALPFPDADTTATVTTFTVGERPAAITFHRVTSAANLGAIEGGHAIARERVEQTSRWTTLAAPPKHPRRPGLIELGEICRVHRGQVTGSNAVWIAGERSDDLPPSLLFPTVTRARELFAAGDCLGALDGLRSVIDLPPDLDVLDAAARRAVEAFLRRARRAGAHLAFVAKNRRAWWSVGLRAPAPILATYMARRPPAFVRNLAGARHINIAHGLYPRAPLTSTALDALAAYLARATSTADGRTYAGGLTKFEPREMERLLVPEPA